jgi:multiple sugar transport system ATP-binding protein
MAFLVLDNLVKRYGKSAVLNGVSVEMQRGETLVVCGPSGSGKTTLLRIVAGVVVPDEGDLRLDGRSVVGQGPETRDVGMAFQNFALYPHLSAFENIASPLRARRLDAATIKRKVQEVAELLRIGHVLQHMPRELSNGQKQRTALARSLVRGPAVLLLDDPLRNVDAKLRYEMRLELPRLLRSFGSTVIYVTQDYKEAMALGDRVGVLAGGTFQQVAEPGLIYGAPRSVEIARLFGDPTINLLPCRPERDGQKVVAEVLDTRLPLAGGLAAAAGHDCLLGVRPEDVDVSTQPAAGALPMSLEAVTPLNVRAVLLLRTKGGQELLATCPEDDAARFGRGHRQVWARIASERALLFDRANGARIAPLAA